MTGVRETEPPAGVQARGHVFAGGTGACGDKKCAEWELVSDREVCGEEGVWQEQQPGVRKWGKFLWNLTPMFLQQGEEMVMIGVRALTQNLDGIGKIFSSETVWLEIKRKDQFI